MNRLFNIVRGSIGHLIVVLNNATLTRPWCAGEITTAMRNDIPIITLQTLDFTPPTLRRGVGLNESLGFNYDESGLAAYGIEDNYTAFLEIQKTLLTSCWI